MLVDIREERNSQFRATDKWNRIIAKFCKDVPRKVHLKKFRLCADTFTGKEAVKFLLKVLPDLVDANCEVTKEKCEKLMEKLLEDRTVLHFQGQESTSLQSSHLYVLSPAAEEIARSAQTLKLKTRKSFRKEMAKKERAAGDMPGPSSIYARRERIFLKRKMQQERREATKCSEV
ncbi:hypothetical protein QR680_018421 [Steinernema hermaphroditum]|uniref:DEP domain-containing protein n=1 Tax=Steinernema hermaphroditum TaxID=289476 RepID=A0AA39LQT7_9BILA|nr:hypothetical protein QR680_018421 [Steinernema hermaphroditum]